MDACRRRYREPQDLLLTGRARRWRPSSGDRGEDHENKSHHRTECLRARERRPAVVGSNNHRCGHANGRVTLLGQAGVYRLNAMRAQRAILTIHEHNLPHTPGSSAGRGQ